MSKLMRTSLLWFSTALALIFTLLLTASVQAYTIYASAWPNANTTYRRDASYSNIIGWNAQADVAVADWNPWFQFNLNNASGNILQAADLGANGFLGVTNATESGHHRTSFTITMNTNKLWHSGAPPVPFNRFDLRSVLRHEFGHALGLWHSGGANTLMNSIIPQGASRLVDQDAQNGANFLYNPAANPPIPEGPGLSSVISSGTADDASPILYPFIGYKSGSWVAATNWPRAYVNTISWSNSNQASYWFWFNGANVTRLYAKAANRGDVNVFIDGVNVGTMNDNSALTSWQVRRTWGVTNGQHFVEVRKSAGNFIDIDGFIVNVGAAGSGAYDDTNGSQLNRIGSSWVQSCCWPNAYQNTISWANATEDAFTFTFTGSQVRYYFTKASNRGIARVTIDGVDYGTIDLYSPNAQWQQSVLYASLGPGIHTIHIAVSGQKNANSTGFFIDVDRLDVP